MASKPFCEIQLSKSIKNYKGYQTVFANNPNRNTTHDKQINTPMKTQKGNRLSKHVAKHVCFLDHSRLKVFVYLPVHIQSDAAGIQLGCWVSRGGRLGRRGGRLSRAGPTGPARAVQTARPARLAGPARPARSARHPQCANSFQPSHSLSIYIYIYIYVCICTHIFSVFGLAAFVSTTTCAIGPSEAGAFDALNAH